MYLAAAMQQPQLLAKGASEASIGAADALYHSPITPKDHIVGGGESWKTAWHSGLDLQCDTVQNEIVALWEYSFVGSAQQSPYESIITNVTLEM